jgi:hypothetical protein
MSNHEEGGRLPELEIRGCPAFLTDSAARILQKVCGTRNKNRLTSQQAKVRVTPKCPFSFIAQEPLFAVVRASAQLV